MFGTIVEGLLNTAERYATNPLEAAVDDLTRPITDSIDLIDGLTEGEIRLKAALRLGADIALGMTADQLVSWYLENH